MSDDTFFGGGSDDRTVLKPTPGGRARASAPQRRPVAAAPLPSDLPDVPRVDGSDVNTLVGAASTLLALAPRLSTVVDHPDPEGLFAHVADEIRRFEAAARAANQRPEVVLTARYALCTLLDEAALNTPWGSQSVWASRTLLNVFHNEGWGGEKFFQVLDRVMQQPAANLDLLELMYLCMAMGLMGKYRVQSNGRAQLEAVQANVLQTLRAHRGASERELSPHWRGVEDARPTLARYVPLWVVGAVSGGLLIALYVGLLLALNTISDPVAAEIAALGRNAAPVVERAPQPAAPRLAELLADEIARGALEVRAENGSETVVLREGLFASGSGEVVPAQRPLLETVAAALARVDGQILIAGHTDDVPIRTLRFPSNWQLSQRRAEAVREILAEVVEPSRMLAEGRADSEPLVPNDSPANRALNRRVEIALLPSPSRE